LPGAAEVEGGREEGVEGGREGESRPVSLRMGSAL
jgi:hypothetical protein